MKIDYLDILLGSACNLHCEYCVQNSFEASVLNKKEDAKKFVENLLLYFKKNNLEALPSRISYWGGEPLLYMDSLKTVHDILFESGIKPILCSRISTNGTLIDEEYVNWANSYGDIKTTVSLHGNNFSDDQIRLIGNLDRVIFTEIISHKRTDFNEIREWYHHFKNLTGKEIPIVPIFLNAVDYGYEDYFLTIEDVDVLISNILELKRIDAEFANMIIYYLKQDKIKNTKMPENNNFCVNGDRLSLDLHGNKYQCHHNFSSENIVGNIFNQKKIVKIKEIDYNRFFNSTECKNCEIRSMCRGYCPISKTHSVDCYLNKQIVLL